MAESISTFTRDDPPGSLITRDGQMQWAGLLIGPGTPYRIDRQGITGWEDLPDIDLSDAERPTGHGAWPGAGYAKSRKVGGQIWLLPQPDPDNPDTAEAALATVRMLRQALAQQDEERWLAIRLHGETLAVRARVNQRVLTSDRQFATQGVAKATVQWLASDPRRYLTTPQSTSTGAPVWESGLTWPLTWPLYWGEAASTGDVAVDNRGSAPTHPVITFRGPCSNPSLTERTSGQRLRYEIDLGADEELVVDTAAGTVTLNGTAARRHTAASDSSPEELFTFAPGRSELSFRPGQADAGAEVSVSWRSAEW
ncbi:phage distal tail protein [Peterkaempfera bronchialis]|uniref:Phage tail protein n=1 Tax=Peterkaempfera bronchialis TaxID=2126346 RepID=A0A345SWF6_9ACTN|nr:phage tail domain-containing protein [Peterkaempfera bronchialis]AXI78061.1 phage tail protein [Peterkaempfera bronchialis]